MLHIAHTAKRNGIFHAVSFCVRPAAFVLLFCPASSGTISICSSRKYLQQNLIFFLYCQKYVSTLPNILLTVS